MTEIIYSSAGKIRAVNEIGGSRDFVKIRIPGDGFGILQVGKKNYNFKGESLNIKKEDIGEDGTDIKYYGKNFPLSLERPKREGDRVLPAFDTAKAILDLRRQIEELVMEVQKNRSEIDSQKDEIKKGVTF